MNGDRSVLEPSTFKEIKESQSMNDFNSGKQERRLRGGQEPGHTSKGDVLNV